MKATWYSAAIAVLVALLVPALPALSGDDLPDVKTVVAGHVAAIGGADVVAGHQSVTVRGSFVMTAASISGEFTQYLSAEYGYRMDIEISGMGTFGEGYHDGVAWSLDPMQGPRVLDGHRAKALALRAVFPPELNYDAMYESMEVVGVEEFGGRQCYRVSLDPGWGSPRVEFFDVETGLMAGVRSDEPGPDGGTMAITTTFHDYTDHGGHLLPKRTDQATPMGSQVIAIEEVEFNNVEEASVQPPSAVQSLLEDESGN